MDIVEIFRLLVFIFLKVVLEDQFQVSIHVKFNESSFF